MIPAKVPANILVVDDLPANLNLLTSLLQGRGYKVRPVPSGRLALNAAHQIPPDLILLDINMPEMNGYEVCTELKANPRLAEIPVIFISALDDAMDKVKAFSMGAVDYVTKPIQFEEVAARVQTHLELSRLRRELVSHNERLEQAVSERTRELSEAKERLGILDRSKNDFLALIAHELRTPLVGIFGVAELILQSFADNPEHANFSSIYEQSRKRMMALIDDALLLAQIGCAAGAEPDQVSSLDALLAIATTQAAELAGFQHVSFSQPPHALGQVCGSHNYLLHALRCLLETSVKFAAENSVIRLIAAPAPNRATIMIEAAGLAIPNEYLPRFFDLLAIAEPITGGGDLGIAPALAEKIVTLYGGSVSVENLTPPGIRLSVCFKTPERTSP